MIKKILFTIILIVLLIAVGGYFARNILVERGVEAGSSYALGVETDLESAELALSAGSLELNQFSVENPQGFESKNFLVIGHGLLDVETGSVLGDEVLVDSLILESIRINIEQIDARGNYLVLLDNLKQLNMESSSDDQQKFRIRHTAVRDISVDASLTLLGKRQYEKTFTVDNISLENIGGDNGATIAQVTSHILKAVISKAASTGRGLLPGGLGENIDQVKDAASQKAKKEVSDRVKDLGGSLLDGDK